MTILLDHTSNSKTTGRALFLAALTIGIVLRVIWVAQPGTGDVDYFKGWSVAASQFGVERLYPPYPPQLEDIFKNTYKLPVAYPPMTVYYLWLVGKTYQFLPGTFHTPAVLNVLVKLPGMLLELIAALVLYRYVKHRSDGRSGLIAFAVTWLNPALIIAGSVMGYQDSVTLSLCLIGLVAALQGSVVFACVLFIVTLMIKQMALFIFPVLVIYCVMTAGYRKALLGVFFVLIMFCLIHAPFMAQATFPFLTTSGRMVDVYRHLVGYSIHHTVSANALNVWWIYTTIVTALGQLGHPGTILNVFGHLHVTIIQTLDPTVHIAARATYIIFTLGNMLLLVKRRTSTNAYFFAAAMQFYGYFMFMTGVHENHLLYAPLFLVPLISTKSSIRYFYGAVSVMAFLNLFVFYGPLGDSAFREIPYFALLTLCLSVLNVLIFFWGCYALIMEQYLAGGEPVPDTGQPFLSMPFFAALNIDMTHYREEP